MPDSYHRTAGFFSLIAAEAAGKSKKKEMPNLGISLH